MSIKIGFDIHNMLGGPHGSLEETFQWNVGGIFKNKDASIGFVVKRRKRIKCGLLVVVFWWI